MLQLWAAPRAYIHNPMQSIELLSCDSYLGLSNQQNRNKRALVVNSTESLFWDTRVQPLGYTAEYSTHRANKNVGLFMIKVQDVIDWFQNGRSLTPQRITCKTIPMSLQLQRTHYSWDGRHTCSVELKIGIIFPTDLGAVQQIFQDGERN